MIDIEEIDKLLSKINNDNGHKFAIEHIQINNFLEQQQEIIRYLKSVNESLESVILAKEASENQKIEKLEAEIESLKNPWIFRGDVKSINEDPHRNVLTAYTDAAGKIFTSLTSSQMVNYCTWYAYMEVEPLPKPLEGE